MPKQVVGTRASNAAPPQSIVDIPHQEISMYKNLLKQVAAIRFREESQ